MNLKHLFLSALVVLIAAYLLPGVTVNVVGAVVAVVVLTLVNMFIKPLVFILTLPINIITLGLFSLVINALMIMLVAYLVPGFGVAGFWSAFFFAILVSIINTFFVGKPEANITN